MAEDLLFRMANVGGVNEFSNISDDELQKFVAPGKPGHWRSQSGHYPTQQLDGASDG